MQLLSIAGISDEDGNTRPHFILLFDLVLEKIIHELGMISINSYECRLVEGHYTKKLYAKICQCQQDSENTQTADTNVYDI